MWNVDVMDWWLPPGKSPFTNADAHYANPDILLSIHQFTTERTLAQQQGIPSRAPTAPVSDDKQHANTSGSASGLAATGGGGLSGDMSSDLRDMKGLFSALSISERGDELGKMSLSSGSAPSSVYDRRVSTTTAATATTVPTAATSPTAEGGDDKALLQQTYEVGSWDERGQI
jgi:hypothetical protein